MGQRDGVLGRRGVPAREAELQYEPSEWIGSEPADPFVAKLAQSLGVDGLVVARAAVCWDAADPAIGLCPGLPSGLVWYSADGKVLMAPSLMPPPPDQANASPNPMTMKKDEPLATKLYVRTPLPADHARAVQAIEAIYRNMVIKAFDDGKAEVEAAQKRGEKVDLIKKVSDFDALTASLQWAPTDEFLADLDPVADKVVTAILQPEGR